MRSAFWVLHWGCRGVGSNSAVPTIFISRFNFPFVKDKLQFLLANFLLQNFSYVIQISDTLVISGTFVHQQ
jgi:hypothetical protein